MDNFFTICIPVFSGLCFLSYRHPALARKLLYILQWILIGGFGLFSFYHTVKRNAYHESTLVSYVVDLKAKSFSLDIDSLYESEKDRDKRDSIIAEYHELRDKNSELLDGKVAVQDSVRAKIRVLIDKSNETYDNIVPYMALAYGGYYPLYTMPYFRETPQFGNCFR